MSEWVDWQAFLRLADEATAGPWKAEVDDNGGDYPADCWWGGGPGVQSPEQAAKDAAFLSASRTIAPLAVRRVLRLEAAIQEAIDYTGNRQDEWGCRAVECFRILEEALRGD